MFVCVFQTKKKLIVSEIENMMWSLLDRERESYVQSSLSGKGEGDEDIEKEAYNLFCLPKT